jgi:hypothetical protein
MRESEARFKWCAAARRSGKSTDGRAYILRGHGPKDAKGLRLFRGAMQPPSDVIDPTYVVAAPTREMVKRLWWPQLKREIPRDFIGSVSETELMITLANGARLICLGMDRPTRGEGFAIDGLVGDEFAYWKPKAFDESLRPALSTRGRPPGWAILLGKPCGRNHFWEAWSAAKAGKVGHDAFHWMSAVLLAAPELEQAKRDMDARSFAQEYEASFLTQSGRICTEFDANKHLRAATYDPALDLVLALDFNVSPGSAVVIQEQPLAPWDQPKADPRMHTAVIDEVHIADDSTTRLVCERFAARYAGHKRAVLIYGDTSGNDRHTSASSNDYAQVLALLRRTFPDVRLRVPRAKPPVIDSVNSVNTRMQSADGTVRFAISAKAQQTLLDIEGVTWEDGPDRDIDKSNDKRTHWLDALRYYVHEAHPLGGHVGGVRA